MRSRSLINGVLVALCILFAGALAAQAGSTPRASAPPRPGDQVKIAIFADTIGGEFTVDMDGYVVLPMKGRVRVSDRSVYELTEEFRAWYVEYSRNPAVEVTFLRRVAVLGAVREPDIYMVDPTVSLRDAIAMAGGFSPEANPRRLTVFRGDEQIVLQGSDARFRIMELESGDQILVGERSWVQRNSLAVVSTAMVVIQFARSFLN
jgi:polysaccharide biosynthesis/export protein